MIRSRFEIITSACDGRVSGIGGKFISRMIALLTVCGIVFSCLSERASFAFSIDDENKLGKEIYDKLNRGNFLLRDKRANDYIEKLGNKIASQNSSTYFRFRFSIVNSSAVNAFATPGGYVYLNKGLITLVENENELAGVLAHEIAHVNARHIASQIEKSQKIGIATLAAIVAGAFLGGGGTGSEAALGISMATSGALQLKFSRENEEEADRLGMNYLVAAGYDGRGMLDFLKIMKNYEFYSNAIPSYFLTHPGTDERIHYIDGLLQARYRRYGGSTNIIGGLKRIQTILMLSEKDVAVPQKYFQEKLNKNGEDVDALYGAAVIQSRLGRIDEAVTNFYKALKIRPDDVDVLRELGICYFKSGKTVDAIGVLRKAMLLNDDDEDTLLYLGRSYEEINDYRTALNLYLRYQKKRPDDSDIYYNLAMNYGKANDQGESHFNFGMFFKKKGKTESALFHFKEALKYFQPNSQRASDIQKEIELLQTEKKRPPAPAKKLLF
ncbi:MAG: M48 family metalloprotease [Syntrophales bacterium]